MKLLQRAYKLASEHEWDVLISLRADLFFKRDLADLTRPPVTERLWLPFREGLPEHPPHVLVPSNKSHQVKDVYMPGRSPLALLRRAADHPAAHACLVPISAYNAQSTSSSGIGCWDQHGLGRFN